MAAAVDGALTARERTALDAHVAGCATCAREMRLTDALLTAVDGLGRETEVPARLEQATLRRIRLADDETPAPGRWWSWLATPVPALALATTVVLALSVTALRNVARVPSAPPAAAPQVATAPPPAAAPTAPRVVASAKPAPSVAPAPAEPPPALAERPDLFIEMPILRHMEKLSHFEAIETTTLDDGEGGTGTRDGASG